MTHDAPDMQSPSDDASVDATAIQDLEQRLGEELDQLEGLVREHPLATLGIAAAAGLIVALVLSRR